MKVIIAFCLIGFVAAQSGGWSPVSVNNPEVVKAASTAINYHNQNSDNPNYKKLVSIKSAESQVVSGTNYALKLNILETECPKDDVNSIKCSPSSKSIPEECDYVVYVPLNSNKGEVTSNSCSSNHSYESSQSQ
ncbi:cystatin-1-like [Panonychus citri]|uniref:cystatin-1-like n=1 Tax=Panonychus citri TaxID=50023 RepID=UPI0023081611|nr:cystatin-1-like [Panonychus citri]